MPQLQVQRDLTQTKWPQQVSRRWILIVGLGVILLLLGIGWWTSREVESSVREKLHGELTTILQSATAALEMWHRDQQRNIHLVVKDPLIRELTAEIADTQATDNESAARLVAQIEILQDMLERISSAYGYSVFAVINPTGEVFASSHDQLLGTRALTKANGFVSKALEGETCVSTPFRFDLNSGLTTGPSAHPMIFVAAPIYDQHQRRIAVVALGMPAEQDFTRVLDVARSGDSGETYAFDREARLVSESRFDHQLHQIGLLAEDQRAILNIRIHDPGGDMTTGYRPQQQPEDWSRTQMAIEALAAQKRADSNVQVDLDGYRDYRGVKVIGAWKWLHNADIGVTTELDMAEAYRPLQRLRTIFVTLLLLLFVGVMAAVSFAHSAKVWQRQHQSARKKLAQLGQYTLEERIGRGGMGDVYRAQHMLLRRPTAVKLLRRAAHDGNAIERFEREVHHTSQLTHPNTIAIYDFGFTPEGVFYYAMEYLDGATSKDVVAVGGPMPESRVIHVLLQVCGSLAEAHQRGLIHRDIKPANIMLCDRGGIADFVKVLDFGLVKDTSSDEKQLTAAATFGGTPHFMSPEAVRSAKQMDARSDIYSLGAVAYLLLTSEYVFNEKNLMTVCMHHCETLPEAPSIRLGRALDADLEEVILQCLAKSPDERPQTIVELRDQLQACRAAGGWTQSQAHNWWANHGEHCRQNSLNEQTQFVHAAETIVVDTDQRADEVL